MEKQKFTADESADGLEKFWLVYQEACLIHQNLLEEFLREKKIELNNESFASRKISPIHFDDHSDKLFMVQLCKLMANCGEVWILESDILSRQKDQESFKKFVDNASDELMAQVTAERSISFLEYGVYIHLEAQKKQSIELYHGQARINSDEQMFAVIKKVAIGIGILILIALLAGVGSPST